MFDSHCHLDDDAYDHDRAAVLTRAEAAGVVGVFVPGWLPDKWTALGALCASSPLLSCGVGLHPWYVHTLSPAELQRALAALPQIIAEQGACAVGECGLDKPKAKAGGAPLDVQTAVLRVHLDVARALALPVVLHCVEAHGALLALLEEGGPLPAGGVMHSYSGPGELVPRYAALGLTFSFAGIVTRANARRPREAARAVPLERLLVESDGPDQAAASVAPGRSEPAHVALVLDALAELRGEPRRVLDSAITANARRLFRL
jgi:TatD DNase family protein